VCGRTGERGEGGGGAASDHKQETRENVESQSPKERVKRNNVRRGEWETETANRKEVTSTRKNYAFSTKDNSKTSKGGWGGEKNVERKEEGVVLWRMGGFTGYYNTGEILKILKFSKKKERGKHQQGTRPTSCFKKVRK